MSISYPLAMPTDVIGISAIELRVENAVGVTQSPFTLRQQVFQHPGQRWSASVSIAPVNREFGEPWIAFLVALNGPVGTFLLGDPLGARPRGTMKDTSTWFLAGGVWQSDGFWDDAAIWPSAPAGSVFARPRVDGAQAAGGASIAVRGLPISASGVFLPGDYIQLGAGNTATLHKVLLSVTTDAAGAADIYVWPRPRRALADGEIVVYNDPKGRFRLAGNQQSWSIANNLRYGVTFEAVEAL